MILTVGSTVFAMVGCVSVKRGTLGKVVMFSIYAWGLTAESMGIVLVGVVSVRVGTLAIIARTTDVAHNSATPTASGTTVSLAPTTTASLTNACVVAAVAAAPRPTIITIVTDGIVVGTTIAIALAKVDLVG
jgi:hypothetical protein